MATFDGLAIRPTLRCPKCAGSGRATPEEALLRLDDAAIVTWPDDRKKPKTEQLRSMAGMGAPTGSFWGLLYGLLFFVPLLGMAVGAAFGALGAHWLMSASRPIYSRGPG